MKKPRFYALSQTAGRQFIILSPLRGWRCPIVVTPSWPHKRVPGSAGLFLSVTRAGDSFKAAGDSRRTRGDVPKATWAGRVRAQPAPPGIQACSDPTAPSPRSVGNATDSQHPLPRHFSAVFTISSSPTHSFGKRQTSPFPWKPSPSPLTSSKRFSSVSFKNSYF